jgi:Asp-tRNA(Asn)/Glu-tRNA(Gln) amidotransferase B subunit
MQAGATSIPQETRSFDVATGGTTLMRSKGDALDYR